MYFKIKNQLLKGILVPNFSTKVFDAEKFDSFNIKSKTRYVIIMIFNGLPGFPQLKG